MQLWVVCILQFWFFLMQTRLQTGNFDVLDGFLKWLDTLLSVENSNVYGRYEIRYSRPRRWGNPEKMKHFASNNRYNQKLMGHAGRRFLGVSCLLVEESGRR